VIGVFTARPAERTVPQGHCATVSGILRVENGAVKLVTTLKPGLQVKKKKFKIKLQI